MDDSFGTEHQFCIEILAAIDRRADIQTRRGLASIAADWIEENGNGVLASDLRRSSFCIVRTRKGGPLHFASFPKTARGVEGEVVVAAFWPSPGNRPLYYRS